MQYVFYPERVCAKVFMVEVDEATRTIIKFDFQGGCPGNLQAINRLTRGMHIDDVIERFDNMPICSGSKVTSCPEQIREGLIDLREKLDAGDTSCPTFGLNPFGLKK